MGRVGGCHVVVLSRQAREHPRGKFWENITDVGIPWSQYLNSTPWGRDIVMQVTRFYIVWLEDVDRPGFFAETSTTGVEWRIDPMASTPLQSGRDGVSWV